MRGLLCLCLCVIGIGLFSVWYGGQLSMHTVTTPVIKNYTITDDKTSYHATEFLINPISKCVSFRDDNGPIGTLCIPYTIDSTINE